MEHLSAFLIKEYPDVLAEYYRTIRPNWLETGVRYMYLRDYPSTQDITRFGLAKCLREDDMFTYTGYDVTPSGNVNYFQYVCGGASLCFTEAEALKKVRRVVEQCAFEDNKVNLHITKKVEVAGVPLCIVDSYGKDYTGKIPTMRYVVSMWDNPAENRRVASVRLGCDGASIWVDTVFRKNVYAFAEDYTFRVDNPNYAKVAAVNYVLSNETPVRGGRELTEYEKEMINILPY